MRFHQLHIPIDRLGSPYIMRSIALVDTVLGHIGSIKGTTGIKSKPLSE